MLFSKWEVRERIKNDSIKLATLALLMGTYQADEYNLYLRQCNAVDATEAISIEVAMSELELNYIQAINKLV